MKQNTHSGIGAIKDLLGGFLHWWRGELADMVPDFFKRPSATAGDLLLALFQPDRVTLFERRAAEWIEMGGFDHDAEAAKVVSVVGTANERRHTIIARLPQEAVLCRRLTLPFAAEKELQQVLSYQLDTLSPYPPDQINFSQRIVQRNYSERTLEVELCLVPKSEVKQITERMKKWGLMPDIVDFNGGEELGEPSVNLLSAPLASDPAKPIVSRTTKLLLVINALLVTALIGSQLATRASNEEMLKTRVDTMRLKADSATKLRNRVEQLRSERNLLRNMKRERPPVVAIIDELSLILPDQTWLEKASYAKQEIRLSGISSKASVLISGIETSNLFENAAFQASVVQDDRSGGERFQISADISTAISNAE